MSAAPALRQPVPDKEWTLITDTSGMGLGAVFGQPDEKGKLAPIAFISRKLKGAEKNYPLRDQEGLAIYWAIPGSLLSKQTIGHCLRYLGGGD